MCQHVTTGSMKIFTKYNVVIIKEVQGHRNNIINNNNDKKCYSWCSASVTKNVCDVGCIICLLLNSNMSDAKYGFKKSFIIPSSDRYSICLFRPSIIPLEHIRLEIWSVCAMQLGVHIPRTYMYAVTET